MTQSNKHRSSSSFFLTAAIVITSTVLPLSLLISSWCLSATELASLVGKQGTTSDSHSRRRAPAEDEEMVATAAGTLISHNDIAHPFLLIFPGPDLDVW